MFMFNNSRCAPWCAVLIASIVVDPLSALAENRSFDGMGNNLANEDWGAAETSFARVAPAAYVDGISVPRIAGRPNPQGVSNSLFGQSESMPSRRSLSGYVYAFGQFITHDIQETVSGNTESIEFRIPFDDEIFVPGLRVPLTRSLFDAETGTSTENPRQQLNFATSYLDASTVYGSNELTASVLRGGPARPGAKLRTSDDINGDGENMLPHDAFGPVPEAPYAAGDSRVNDNVVLTAIHTLFMREHNRLVDELAVQHTAWSADELYQRARKIVGAKIQAITFHEFLPAVLGPYAPEPYAGYDPTVEAAAINEFAAVFLRMGHSMLTNDFKRVENDGQPAEAGPLPLIDAFFVPQLISTSRDLDLFLKGLSVETQEETDLAMTFGVRAGLLGAFDIQRARDHGIADYNSLREAYGLARVTSFAEITSSEDAQAALASTYSNVDAIDPLAGALAEDLLPGASVGPLVAAGFRVQFARLRDGDRFWYENDPAFTVEELTVLRETRLADIIERNTGVTGLVRNVFFAVPEPATVAMTGLGLLCIAGVQRRRGAHKPSAICEGDRPGDQKWLAFAKMTRQL